MVKKTIVADAWEDDWEAQADKGSPEPQPEPQVPQTKSARLAQHVETNRKLWESADSPETFHYLETSSNVPLTGGFKPQVKVLSRKPVIAKRDAASGMSQLTLDDDDEDTRKPTVQLSPEEIRAKQKRDHEEKQRRYEEARAKIFGSNPSSGASSPGTVTPPRSDGHFAPRGRGRGRGGAGGPSGYRGNSDRQQFDRVVAERQPFDNFDNRRQPIPNSSGRELYDPNSSSPKPETQRRGNDSSSSPRSATPREETPAQQQQPLRAPRGPDGSGRGGFGFARRGAKES